MKKYLFAIALLGALSCNNTTTKEPEKQQTLTFAEARKAFTTKLTKQTGSKGTPETPPADLFTIVQYESNIGKMDAYLSTIPNDGKLHPAMIWITGGYSNDIGDVWSDEDPENDQSAGVIRKAGIVMMYPSQRGGNNNPGADETCFGEIDDIIAAADFLAKQKGIDPNRIYLGGHSTGGTKVILAAEASNKFRAVFSLGPVSDVQYYDEEHYTFDTNNPKEFEMREPIRWMSSLQHPLYVFEGSTGNIQPLKEMQVRAKKEDNKMAHFYEIKSKDHFTVIHPISAVIAQKIIADDKGGEANMDFEADVKNIK